jgi:hypothetical protein
MKKKGMENEERGEGAHPKGEWVVRGLERIEGAIPVETYGGRVHVEWDPEQEVTAFGQLPYFIEFLKTAGLFEAWVEGCPIKRSSPNAPTNGEVLGTYLLGVLAGENRYAHITGLRADRVNPGLLGMRKVLSEDAIRRAFEKVEAGECEKWQKEQLKSTYGPLLYEPYILDVDSMVKPLYGKQEGAVVGYNPHKPGRPAHVYHTYLIANLRLVMDVEVEAGNQTAAKYAMPGLWELLDSLPAGARPAMVRGDCAFGNEAIIAGCEWRELPYLFKLRQTANVKKLVDFVSSSSREWSHAGQGWEGIESELRLSGWSRARRVVVLRRKLAEKRKKPHGNTKQKPLLPFMDDVPGAEYYEYAVLVTSLKDEVSTIAQHYRDRADGENNFDELKNQWGWGGYTTKDLKRCQISARIVAQVYNWWTIFVRLAAPHKHLEGITSRPLMLHAIGRQTTHSGQKRIKVTSSHAKAASIQIVLNSISRFLRRISEYAEQLPKAETWRQILSAAFRHFLHGRMLKTPVLLSSHAQ